MRRKLSTSEKVEKARFKLDKAMGRVQVAFQGLSTVSANLDKLGIFAIGYMGAEGASIKEKALGGLYGLIGLSLAKAPNLPASIAGAGMVGSTLAAAKLSVQQKALVARVGVELVEGLKAYVIPWYQR